ncbi:MAG TPA: hypothetical protein VN541_07535 [Tepidisphaeraceae bacterium]|nr:hypothetical protein [Tepidisphaeraceae bacterium]
MSRVKAAALAHLCASYLAALAIMLETLYAMRGTGVGWDVFVRQLGAPFILAPISVPVALVVLPYSFPGQLKLSALYWAVYVAPLLLSYAYFRRRALRSRRGFPVLGVRETDAGGRPPKRGA